MIKRLAIAALASAAFIGSACAQSTVLGPSMTTVTATTTPALATPALASNPSRKALTICNGSATIDVTFTAGPTLLPTSATVGLFLPHGNVAASCFTIGTPGVAGSGGIGAQINIIASSTTAPVTFVEYF
jgi:hypothetical protein